MRFNFESIQFNALKRLHSWYIPASVLAVQLIAFLSSGLATYFTQNNAQFQSSQFGLITRITLVLVLIGDAAMVSWAYTTNKVASNRLELWAKGNKLPTNVPDEVIAWQQINSLPLRFVLFTFVVALMGQVVPLLVYLYFALHITNDQIVYGLLGGLAATFSGSAVAMHLLDFLMHPARKVLLPQKFEDQLANVSIFRLSNKLVGSSLTVVIISVLIMAPIGYHHTIMASNGGQDASAILLSFQVQSIIAGAVNLALGLLLSIFIYRSITNPIERLITSFQKVEQGDFSQRVSITAADEVGELSIHFNRMVERLDFLQASLETQVKERTAQLRATVKVSQAASAILDTNVLIEQVVNLIASEFGYYYVALFLIDPTEKWAELKSATGDAGRVLRENKHRLEIGGRNMVGSAISTREAKVAMDAGGAQVRFDNPLLPYTRSEIALPLMAGDRVLGALDAQSTREGAFGPEDIETLQAMAGQVAIALENARLFQDAQQNLQDIRAIQQQYLLTSWKNITEEKPDLSYENGELDPGEVLNEIKVPLTLRDQLIGQISLAGENEWTPEEKNMIEAIATQAALALENARLVEDGQLTAIREHLVTDVTSKIWASSTIDGILQTAARELGRALDSDEVTIELKAD